MAEWTGSTPRAGDTEQSLERAKIIVSEFTDAARLAALELANERKERAAEQVGGFAEAMRSAARALERNSPAMAGYADQAAGQIEAFSRGLHERRWGEIIADVEDVARRRPALFIATAVAAGLLAGRFLSLAAHPSDRARRAPEELLARSESETVEAAVSSASGNGEIAGWTGESSEAREVP